MAATFEPEWIADAVSVYDLTTVWASLTLAQFAVESGWGAHMPGNNPFGIKHHGRYGSQMLMTYEDQPSGPPKRIPQAFCTYANLHEAFYDHALLFTRVAVYLPALPMLQHGDLFGFIHAMAPHYAPYNAAYPYTLIAVINQHNLREFDAKPISAGGVAP